MRIVIGEDSALFREGLARLLEDAGHTVVAALPDALAAHGDSLRLAALEAGESVWRPSKRRGAARRKAT